MKSRTRFRPLTTDRSYKCASTYESNHGPSLAGVIFLKPLVVETKLGVLQPEVKPIRAIRPVREKYRDENLYMHTFFREFGPCRPA